MGGFEIVQYNNIQESTKSYLVEQSWLCIYPRLTILMYNHGKEFLNNAIEENIIENEYCIKFKCATTENPQANSII